MTDASVHDIYKSQPVLAWWLLAGAGLGTTFLLGIGLRQIANIDQVSVGPVAGTPHVEATVEVNHLSERMCAFEDSPDATHPTLVDDTGYAAQCTDLKSGDYRVQVLVDGETREASKTVRVEVDPPSKATVRVEAAPLPPASRLAANGRSAAVLAAKR